MPDETKPGAGEPAAGETWTEGTPTIEKVRIERDREAKRAKELESQLAAAKSALGEYETFKTKIEEDEARREKDWTKLEEQYRTQLATEKQKREELEKREAARVLRDRQTALLERVAEKTGIKNLKLLRGLLREASDERGIDIAPETMTDDTVSAAVEAVRTMSPELFTHAGTGGSPGVPGTSTKDTSKGAELGRKLSGVYHPGRA